MSQTGQFRVYAAEALRAACDSKAEGNRQALIELARTWTEAAVQSERIFAVRPSEHRAA